MKKLIYLLPIAIMMLVFPNTGSAQTVDPTLEETTGTPGEYGMIPSLFPDSSNRSTTGIYRVNFAGIAGTSDKKFRVQVSNIHTGEGYSSPWPEWAYNIARDAFLFNKQLWIITDNKPPFGSNLLQAHLVSGH